MQSEKYISVVFEFAAGTPKFINQAKKRQVNKMLKLFELFMLVPTLPAKCFSSCICSDIIGVLEGVVMELADCALHLLFQVVPTTDPAVGLKDVAAGFMVRSMPRKEDMERKDLLSVNVNIFKVQSQTLDQRARKDVKVLVIGNPANTNALVCFTAMTRLDQNRATAQIAVKLPVPIIAVQNVIIWVNNISTQFPDARNATVCKKSVWDADLLQGDFDESKLDITANQLVES